MLMGHHRVMLDGVDGDLVMSLTGDYTTGIMRQGDWAGALRELRGAVSNGRSDSVLAGLFRGFRSILIPSWLKRGKYELLGRQEVLSELNDSLLSNSLRQDATIVERYVSHQRLQVERFKTAKEQHRWFISQPYLAVALERYDRIASVCGVEARHPLLDKRLVEFSLNLPWHLKVNRGWGKWMLRWSMQSRLPESTLWRMDKPHLGASFTDAWMKAHWSSFSSLVKSNRELWKPYLSESSVLPYFMTPDYNPEEPVSDPWDIVHLIKWLKLYT
ncbi:MAG TPA: asparagine synthase [Dehalococcoidia bacterium]|nr:asparagine synthase [Dehalococcoidia bacterium]